MKGAFSGALNMQAVQMLFLYIEPMAGTCVQWEVWLGLNYAVRLEIISGDLLVHDRGCHAVVFSLTSPWL